MRMSTDERFTKRALEGELSAPTKADDAEAEGKTYSVAEPDYQVPAYRAMEHWEMFGGIVTIPTTEQMADEIGDLFENEIWELKADLFNKMVAMKMLPEDAEGPDFEHIIKEVLDELWRRA